MKKETIVALAVVLLLAAAGFVFFMESQRNARQQDVDPYSPEAVAARSSNDPPSYFPMFSGKVVVGAGKVASVPASINGPMLLRVTVETTQQMNVAIVPKAQAATFSSQEPLGNMMVDLKCANSGKGNINLACELAADEKDMVVVLGDPRNAGQTLRQSFDVKKDEPATQFYTPADVAIFIAVPKKK